MFPIPFLLFKHFKCFLFKFCFSKILKFFHYDLESIEQKDIHKACLFSCSWNTRWINIIAILAQDSASTKKDHEITISLILAAYLKYAHRIPITPLFTPVLSLLMNKFTSASTNAKKRWCTCHSDTLFSQDREVYTCCSHFEQIISHRTRQNVQE